MPINCVCVVCVGCAVVCVGCGVVCGVVVVVAFRFVSCCLSWFGLGLFVVRFVVVL